MLCSGTLEGVVLGKKMVKQHTSNANASTNGSPSLYLQCLKDKFLFMSSLKNARGRNLAKGLKSIEGLKFVPLLRGVNNAPGGGRIQVYISCLLLFSYLFICPSIFQLGKKRSNADGCPTWRFSKSGKHSSIFLQTQLDIQ